MGVFRRVSDILSSNINDLLDRAEDPEKMAKQLIREMDQAVTEVRSEVARAMASEGRLRARVQDLERGAADWEAKATRSVELGRDDLAEAALGRKRDAQETLDVLRPTLAEAEENTARLRGDLAALEDRVQQARVKRDTLIARSRAARARRQVGHAAGRLDKASRAVNDFESLEGRVAEMEAEAAAVHGLNTGAGEPLETEIRRLDRKAALQEELARLKGGGSSQGGTAES